MKVKKIKINSKKLLFCLLIIGLFVLAINYFNSLIKIKEGKSCGVPRWSKWNNEYCYKIFSGMQSNANRVFAADKDFYTDSKKIDAIRKEKSDINNKINNHGTIVNNLNTEINNLNGQIENAKITIPKS